ncbi:MAG: hypothetical protein ABEH64_09470 [Salinirussus sp.]
MTDGLIDFLEFAAGIVLAAPVALLGVIRLSGGDPVGGVVFLAIAVGMVLLERFVLAPRELVIKMLKGLRSRVVGTGDD